MIDPTNRQIVSLAARVGETLETPADLALAEACLEDAWEWVRSYGSLEWDHNDPSTPGIARTVALNAAARCYQNPSGFVSERGDAVAFERYEDFAKGAEPTRAEIQALKRAANNARSSIKSLRLQNNEMYRPRKTTENRLIERYSLGVGDPDHRPINFYGWRV